MVSFKMFSIVTALMAFTFILPIKCNQKLLLTVYYSSECTDSRTFFVEQLQPTVRALHNYVKVKLIPFGKAKSLDYGMSGFNCQHGLRECFGNMVQDCTLDMMRRSNISDVRMVDYVTCELKKYIDSVRGWECVDNVSIEPQKVQKCVELGKGTVLQLDSEYYTSLIKPQFIPTVTIQGTFNQHFQDTAMRDLMGSLCSLLRGAPPCMHHFNNIAMQDVLNSEPISSHFIRLDT